MLNRFKVGSDAGGQNSRRPGGERREWREMKPVPKYLQKWLEREEKANAALQAPQLSITAHSSNFNWQSSFPEISQLIPSKVAGHVCRVFVSVHDKSLLT